MESVSIEGINGVSFDEINSLSDPLITLDYTDPLIIDSSTIQLTHFPFHAESTLFYAI